MKKPCAADRTVNLFEAPRELTVADAEVLQEEPKGDRLPVEEDVDRMRLNAFTGQEWSTKHFGTYDGPGNEYRVSKRGDYYYLESILKKEGTKAAYGYTGLMVHKKDIVPMTKVLVEAAKESLK